MDSEIDPDPKKLPLGLRLAKIGASKSILKIKVGAALVSKKRYIISWNKKRTSVAAIRHNYKWSNQCHAEFDLFSHTTSGDLPRVSGIVYIYRELADGSLALARPCPYCLDYLQRMGIRKICYTDYGTYKEERI